jgi:hypothetical protein
VTARQGRASRGDGQVVSLGYDIGRSVQGLAGVSVVSCPGCQGWATGPALGDVLGASPSKRLLSGLVVACYSKEFLKSMWLHR